MEVNKKVFYLFIKYDKPLFKISPWLCGVLVVVVYWWCVDVACLARASGYELLYRGG